MLFFGVDIYITDFSGDNRKLFNKIKKALERIEGHCTGSFPGGY
jgi:hypothetical protein